MAFINHFIEYKLYPDDDEVDESPNKYLLPTRIIYELYIYNISDFLAIIPYFIRKKLLKKKEENVNLKTEDNNNTDDSPLIYNDNTELIYDNKKKSVKLYCIIISILDFLHKFPLVLYSIIFTDKEINNN